MIKSREELIYTKNQISRLEDILTSLREKLLPERESQYNAMAGGYIKKIEKFRSEIDEYIGISTYKSSKVDLHMHIEGPNIGYGSVSSRLISNYLDKFKRGLQGIYVAKNNININRIAPKDIRDICDLRLTNFQPGSINLSFEIPKHQISLDRESIDSSIQLYFDIVKWISTDDDRYIKNIDTENIEKLTRSVMQTLPDEKNINKITFSGQIAKLNKPIIIDSDVKKKASEKISSLQLDNNTVTITGIVRGIDLDKRTLALREVRNYNKNEVSCKLSDDLIDDLKQYLDCNVTIQGIKKDAYINIKYIENLD